MIKKDKMENAMRKKTQYYQMCSFFAAAANGKRK